MALCSRITCDVALYERIASQAAALDAQAWGTLPHRAEAHGIAPLLFTHLKAASAPVPTEAQRALRGLTLRHRLANRARMAVLRSILARFGTAGISVCVLKGAALAHLIYPTPGSAPDARRRSARPALGGAAGAAHPARDGLRGAARREC